MTIYCIINELHDKVYVGQTVQPIENRYKQHVCRALANGSQNRALAEDFNKFDEYFSIRILQHLDDNLDSNVVYEIEDYWINKMIVEGYGTYNKDGVRKDPEIFIIEMEDKYGDNLLEVSKFINKEIDDSYDESIEEETNVNENFVDLKTGKTYSTLVDCFRDTGVATYNIKRSCLGDLENGRFIYEKDNHGQSYVPCDILEDNSVYNHKTKRPGVLILARRLNRIYISREACMLGENISKQKLDKILKENNGELVVLDTRVPEHLLYHPDKSKKRLMKDAKEVSEMFLNEPVITSEVAVKAEKLATAAEVKAEDLKAFTKEDFAVIIFEVLRAYGVQKAAELLVKFEELF